MLVKGPGNPAGSVFLEFN